MPDALKQPRIMSMVELKIEISEESLDSDVEELSRGILLASALQIYKDGHLSAEKASQLAKLSEEQFRLEAGEEPELGEQTSVDIVHQPPQARDAVQGSRYLARVLWALSEGEKQDLIPMTAAEIAKFVTANSSVKIEVTNTARFFRDCRGDGRFEEYWSTVTSGTRRRYVLTEQGREVLGRVLV